MVSDVLLLLLEIGYLSVTAYHLLLYGESLLIVDGRLLGELAVLSDGHLAELVVHSLFEVPLVLFLLGEILLGELLPLIDQSAPVVLLQDQLLTDLTELCLVHQPVLDLFILEMLDLLFELTEQVNVLLLLLLNFTPVVLGRLLLLGSTKLDIVIEPPPGVVGE